jgi:hypothetical protein
MLPTSCSSFITNSVARFRPTSNITNETKLRALTIDFWLYFQHQEPSFTFTVGCWLVDLHLSTGVLRGRNSINCILFLIASSSWSHIQDTEGLVPRAELLIVFMWSCLIPIVVNSGQEHKTRVVCTVIPRRGFLDCRRAILLYCTLRHTPASLIKLVFGLQCIRRYDLRTNIFIVPHSWNE